MVLRLTRERNATPPEPGQLSGPIDRESMRLDLDLGAVLLALALFARSIG